MRENDYLKRLRKGEENAFCYLFKKYFPKVKYFISHIVQSEDIAEDLSQDIFLKIWINRQDLPDFRSFDAYLFRMSKNKALNYLEHKLCEDVYRERREIPVVRALNEELEAKELEDLIKQAVGKMPEQRKKVYVLSRLHHVGNEEIAKRLNVSKKTVENHINLALKQIRKTIELSSVKHIFN